MEAPRGAPQPDRSATRPGLRRSQSASGPCCRRGTARASAGGSGPPPPMKEGVMTVRELIDEPECCDGEAEVRILAQPSWPFEYTIAAVVAATGQPEDLSGYRETPAPRLARRGSGGLLRRQAGVRVGSETSGSGPGRRLGARTTAASGWPPAASDGVSESHAVQQRAPPPAGGLPRAVLGVHPNAAPGRPSGRARGGAG